MKRNEEVEGSSTLPGWLYGKRKSRRRCAPNKCANCGAEFRLPRSYSIDAIDPSGLFCTLRCAAKYGTRAAAESRRRGAVRV